MRLVTFESIIFTMLLAAGQVKAGINCEGSSACPLKSAKHMQHLRNLVNDIDPNRWYNNGDNIACVGPVSSAWTVTWTCAFLQGTGGAPGKSIPALLQSLLDHGCINCGSVPLYYPVNGDNNDGDHGILTVNEVYNPACENRLC
jgi:hypothetical protein